MRLIDDDGSIAAARRRLPMTEVSNAVLLGEHGRVSLLDVFDGRSQLIVYKHMWHDVQAIEHQCEGCTATIWDVPLLGRETEGAYVSLLRRGSRVFATNWITGRGVEAMMSSMALADMTAYARQEAWEDSPAGWPQRPTFFAWTTDGRPTAKWSRPGATPVAASARHH